MVGGGAAEEAGVKIASVPFGTIDWSSVEAVRHPGEAGVAIWRTVQAGDIRIRVVEYSPGYRADHWCERGHILYVLEGELITELKDGSGHVLKAGMSYQVAEGVAPHRSSSRTGARLFIVD